MKKEIYTLMETYMLSCMDNSAHDREHVYRVLYNALDIAQTEENVDYDVLISACLLHDVGRKEQFENPKLCHAMVGADKAYHFLREQGFDEAFSEKIKSCIQTHRYRKNNLPQSIEAKILFDADKLDAAGAVGIGRTLLYNGQAQEPLYSLLADGQISDGTGDEKPSFFQEYKYKLEKIYDKFFTTRGTELARQRQKTAAAFYRQMYHEVSETYRAGTEYLTKYLQ